MHFGTSFERKNGMADFACHCTSHLYILRDEEMDDCCSGVSVLCFHPGSVTILKKKITSLFCLPSLADIVEAVDEDVDVNDKVQAHNALIIDCTK